MKSSNKPRIRQRSHAIILSSEGFSIDKISSILQIGRDAISRWHIHGKYQAWKG